MIVLVQTPSPELSAGQRTFVDRAALDFERACQQHRNYITALRDCGAEVTCLDATTVAPDSVFIEDTAIVLDDMAVLCSMGTTARSDEPTTVRPVLEQYRELEVIQLPARIEGGDVLRVGKKLIVGLSQRTDQAGVDALKAIVEPRGFSVTAIPVERCLHLKTACTALPDGRLLMNPNWIDAHSLAGFDTVWIPRNEPWGANTLPLGGAVILPADHSKTAELIQQQGFAVKPVDISEFAKAEGGVTCLSLVLGS